MLVPNYSKDNLNNVTAKFLNISIYLGINIWRRQLLVKITEHLRPVISNGYGFNQTGYRSRE